MLAETVMFFRFH